MLKGTVLFEISKIKNHFTKYIKSFTVFFIQNELLFL